VTGGERDLERSSSRKGAVSRKSSVSKARTYAEIGDFWEEHDLSDYWGKTGLSELM
jgi:hypothetical protein